MHSVHALPSQWRHPRLDPWGGRDSLQVQRSETRPNLPNPSPAMPWSWGTPATTGSSFPQTRLFPLEKKFGRSTWPWPGRSSRSLFLDSCDLKLWCETFSIKLPSNHPTPMENVVFFHFFLPPHTGRLYPVHALPSQWRHSWLDPWRSRDPVQVTNLSKLLMIFFWCSYGMELRDTGEYGFILPPNQIIPTGEEVWAFHMTVARQIIQEFVPKHLWNGTLLWNFLNKSFLNSSTCLWPKRPCMVNRSPLRDDTDNGDEIWHYIMLQEDAIFVSTQKEHLHLGKKTCNPLNQIIRHRGCLPASDHFLVWQTLFVWQSTTMLPAIDTHARGFCVLHLHHTHYTSAVLPLFFTQTPILSTAKKTHF